MARLSNVTMLAAVQQEVAEIRMPEQEPWPELPKDAFHFAACEN
jgi:hypothetical protein